jgi:hypothetical protein
MNIPNIPTDRLQAWLEDIAAVCVSHGLVPDEIEQDCPPTVVEIGTETRWLVVDWKGLFYPDTQDPNLFHGRDGAKPLDPLFVPRAVVRLPETAHERLTAAARRAALKAKP